MTSTIATVRGEVTARLNVTASTGPVPSIAQIDLWIIHAFKEAIGRVPFVKETTVTVSSTAFSATLTADRVFFCAYKNNLLLPGEWEKQGATLQFTAGSVAKSGTVQVWYFLDPDLTDASTTVDTTCIFGADWLEEPATVKTMMHVSARMQSASQSAASPDYITNYRVFQDEYEKIMTAYERRFQDWRGEMTQRQQGRIAVGDLPLKEHPYAGFRNKSRIINRINAIG